MQKMIMVDKVIEHLERRGIPYKRESDDMITGEGWTVRPTFSRTVKGTMMYVVCFPRTRMPRSRWEWIADPYNVADRLEGIHYGC